MANEEKERKCWACHKTLVGKGSLGLCSTCANRYGTTAGLLVLGIGTGGKYLIKNGGKILNLIKKV